MRNRAISLLHEFVEFIPSDIQEGKLYISIPFATATHKCCCGCEKEVVTPLSPTDWKLIFDGQSVSLDPSIGNWSFDCQSHYWIKRNQAIWSYHWSSEQIQSNRACDRNAKEHYYQKEKFLMSSPANPKELLPTPNPPGFLSRVKRWLLK